MNKPKHDSPKPKGLIIIDCGFIGNALSLEATLYVNPDHWGINISLILVTIHIAVFKAPAE